MKNQALPFSDHKMKWNMKWSKSLLIRLCVQQQQQQQHTQLEDAPTSTTDSGILNPDQDTPLWVPKALGPPESFSCYVIYVITIS